MNPNEIASQQGKVSTEEWRTRVDLAACYRIIAMYGWDDLIFTHVSARVPGTEAQFLINPYGMFFEEITASSLVLVNDACEKLRDSPFPVNRAGFVIHSAVHEARADVQCVVHTHTVEGAAVAAQRNGLRPISQAASIVLNGLGYHDYEGIAVREDEKPRLVADLGTNTFLILRNHGLLTVGSSIMDAFLFMYALQKSCEVQVHAQDGGELVEVSSQILAGVQKNFDAVLEGMGGGLVWPGLLRKLDRTNPGFRS